MIRGSFFYDRRERRPSVVGSETACLGDNLLDVLVKIERAVDTLPIALGN
jgi:hypothetical protein